MVTDRQLLAIEDERPRSDFAWWGYDARSIPLERVVDVTVSSDGLLARSEVGGPALAIQLPTDVRPVIDDVVAFVGRFARRAEMLPMRRYVVAARAEPLLAPEGWPDAPAIGARLLAELERELNVAPLIAAYVKPARVGRDREGVLALYPDQLVFVPLAAAAHPIRLALASVAWVELRRSILTSHLRVVGAREERWPSASSDGLVPFFAALRQLIANPAACAKGRVDE